MSIKYCVSLTIYRLRFLSVIAVSLEDCLCCTSYSSLRFIQQKYFFYSFVEDFSGLEENFAFSHYGLCSSDSSDWILNERLALLSTMLPNHLS
jgi:hypothetical protein